MDWALFLEDNQISFVTRGPNTKRGEVSVQCPWCGDEDPSQHLGISLTSENWGCLRDRSHSGHSAWRLIAGLVGCSKAQAKLIAAQYGRSDPNTLGGALAMLEGTSEPDSPAEAPPEEPPIQLPIYTDWPRTKHVVRKRFWDYLKSRGFNNPRKLINRYKLTCATTGRYKDRIIIPVYRGGKMVAWTARAIIDPKEAPRYLSSKNLKATVFNEAELRTVKSNFLMICEGPFDAMKLDFFGKQFKVRATCTFGTNVTIPQVIILNSLLKNFRCGTIVFDFNAVTQAEELYPWLQHSNVGIGFMPQGVKDPADMTEDRVKSFLSYTARFIS